MATKIVAIRHGKPESEGYAEDALRPLSKEGREDQLSIAIALQERGYHPKLILTSPLIRAVQSAEVMASVFKVPVQEEPALGIDFDEQVLFDHIPSPEHGETLFLMGHAPTIAEFVHRLIGERLLSEGIGKSCAVALEFTDAIKWGGARFIGYYRPYNESNLKI